MSLADKREHKVKCDYGMNDYVRYYTKTTESSLNPKVAREIMNDYLKSIRTLISTKGYVFKIPENCGRIEIRKVKREMELDDNGKIINKLPPNWKATNELWAENPRAKEKKIIIRYVNDHTEGFVFFPYYIKRYATFKNKGLYKMQINREMSRNTFQGIISKKIDAFLLYKKN